MIERVKQFIQDHQLIPKNIKHVFVAVSGGIDSCVLLDILVKLKEEYKIELMVVHFNHQVRGRYSFEDEDFVCQLAKSYAIPFNLGRMAKTRTTVSETYLRDQRFSFFDELLSQNPDSLIATGHHLDDNVETVLMRLAKGSRMKGLLGISPSRDRYIRPLLGEKRESIKRYAEKNKIRFCMDRTNQDKKILRNKIRHDIIPYLESNLDADFSGSMARVIDNLNAHFKLYQENVIKVASSCSSQTKNGITIDRKRFLKLDMTLKRGLLEYCISRVYPLNYTISDRSLQIWNTFFADAQAGKIFEFRRNRSALAERNHIFIGELPTERTDSYRLSPGNSVIIDKKWSIELRKISKRAVQFSDDTYIEYIDGGLCGERLTVRFWKKGDFFRPIGMKHRRKLSDFFIDLKLSRRIKNETPLVCKGREIIWIAGHRLDDRYKITDGTKKVYMLQYKKGTE